MFFLKSCSTCGESFKGFGSTCRTCWKDAQRLPKTADDASNRRSPYAKCSRCGSSTGRLISKYNENMCDSCISAASKKTKRVVILHGLEDDEIMNRIPTTGVIVNAHNCDGCQKPMSTSFVNFCGRKYHPNCFKCDGCKTRLSGNALPTGNEILCKLCFSKTSPTKNETCSHCRSPMNGLLSKTRDGTCDACGLNGTKKKKRVVFFQDNGNVDEKKGLRAPTSFVRKNSDCCTDCHKQLSGSIKNFRGKKYHPDCLKCETCQKILSEDIHPIGGGNFCKSCVKKGGNDKGTVVGKTKLQNENANTKKMNSNVCPGLNKCVHCRRPIDEQPFVQIQSEVWHARCFRCGNCQVVLDPEKHSTLADNSRVCYNCDPSKRCENCRDAISGDMIEFQGKRYHPTCLKCNECDRVVTYHVTVDGGRNICHMCWNKLQGSQVKSVENHTGTFPRCNSGQQNCVSCCSTVGKNDVVQTKHGVLHKKCFKCDVCQVKLDPTNHSDREDSRLCFKCDPTRGCHKCKKTIYEKAIEFEGRRYHSRCFTCSGCTAILTTDRVVTKNNNKFCQLCCETGCGEQENIFAKVYECVRFCDHCGKQIADHSYVKIDDKYTHLDCFKCHDCKMPLDPEKYSTLPDGRTRICYDCDPKKKCAKCHQTIYDDTTEHHGKSFHPECFCCDDCNKLLKDRVFIKNSRRFCDNCAKSRRQTFESKELIHHASRICVKKTPFRASDSESPRWPPANQKWPLGLPQRGGVVKCDVCFDPVDDLSLKIDGKIMHKLCFRCDRCKAVLDPKMSSAFLDGSTRICFECDPTKKCETCRKTIYDDSCEFKGKRYHPRCLTCDGCYAHLVSRGFMKGGRKYCEECKKNNDRKQTQATKSAPSNLLPVGKTMNLNDCSRCGCFLSGSIVSFGNRKFHSECFRCDGCNDRLSGNVFPLDDKHFCKKCKRTPVPQKDQKTTCRTCSRPIVTSPAALPQGSEFCRGCTTAIICGGCNLAIVGPVKAAIGKKFHAHCFVCSRCTVVLEGSFGMRGANAVCMACLRGGS